MERPAGPIDERIGWGSDVAADMLRRLNVPYVALTPGASFRGLHDSLVNHLGNRRPRMLTCLHEEQAVAIAHGYAKASGRAMAVALHANVGLMHATMAIFNAWCDRQPMLILGATGPLDAARRRPWIDWVHTAQDQAALVRPFVKWDDQPGSAAAIVESMLRGWQIAATPPGGPVYVCLDAALQEQALDRAPAIPDVGRYRPPSPAVADATALDKAAELLRHAERPLILYGRCRRTPEAWERRVALAERLGSAMMSDLKAGSMVPSDHPQHVGDPFNRPSPAIGEVVRAADAILSLGWIDLGGLLDRANEGAPPTARVIHAGTDTHLHRGWGKEHGALPPIDVNLAGDPDAAVEALLGRLAGTSPKAPWHAVPASAAATTTSVDGGALTMADIAVALGAAIGDPITYAALPRGWPVALAPHRDPFAYLGKDGGGGVGSGPGLSIGAALALKGTGRPVVGVIGDGDCMMSINALWTAAHYAIPALLVVANNCSYYNDEVHQERVALARSRNPANKWIGQAIADPTPDFARLAEAQGVGAAGPVTTRQDLAIAVAEAIAAVRAGRPFLVDVHIDPAHGREPATGPDRE